MQLVDLPANDTPGSGSEGRTIAIGDIHGCAAALKTLLQVIQPQASDTIVTLGDYIDRGDDSPGVIEMLLELDRKCQLVSLLGNHEAMLLLATEESSELAFWMECGGRETLDAYGGEISDIPESHFEFIRNCRLYHEMDATFFVHANYAANLPLSRQQEFVLLWEHLSTHVPSQHCSGKRAIVGHTPQRNGEVLVLEHLICIDTFCYGDGWLTALDVNGLSVWQADKSGCLRA